MDSASLKSQIKKFFFSIWIWGFLGVTSQVRVFLRFVAQTPGPGRQPNQPIFWLKIFSETRPKSGYLQPFISVAKIMDKKNKVGENLCTNEPQPGVDYTSFLNGYHLPADRARELF